MSKLVVPNKHTNTTKLALNQLLYCRFGFRSEAREQSPYRGQNIPVLERLKENKNPFLLICTLIHRSGLMIDAVEKAKRRRNRDDPSRRGAAALDQVTTRNFGMVISSLTSSKTTSKPSNSSG